MTESAITIKSNKAYLELYHFDNLQWDNLCTKSVQTMTDISAGSIKAKTKQALSGLLTKYAKQQTEPFAQGIEVQYNPKTLTITGTMEERKNERKQGKASITTITTVGVVIFSVDLVFHAKEWNDSSVRDNMNMLLLLMQKSPTKRVRFSWGDMQITGKVISFQGKYDLFQLSGLPASGSIKMTIQAESEPKKIEQKIEKMTAEREE